MLSSNQQSSYTLHMRVRQRHCSCVISPAFVILRLICMQVVANFENDTGACNILQPANGLWFGRQGPPYANCSIDKTFYQVWFVSRRYLWQIPV